MRELFKVMKDHNNPFMEDLVTKSYQYSFKSLVDEMVDDPSVIDDDECGTECVLRLRCVHPTFQESLKDAIVKIQNANLKLDLYGFDHSHPSTGADTPEQIEPGLGNNLTVLVNDISIAMKSLQYALYRGVVYKKAEKATYTYTYKCDVLVFMHSLAANESFKSRLLSQMKRVVDILSDPHCEVIRPIIVDYDLIEVGNGYCWSISERRFLKEAIPAQKIGQITPRAFSLYDPFKTPDPKYFREILDNSLTDAEIGQFCHDFLNLLRYNQKRHKDKVPCLIGAPDSGKTSLFLPMLGLIHYTNVATITKQKIFNKAMITKFTEVIFIDEVSSSMLDVDDWKTLTQGGYTACDVKYKSARSFFNRCPMIMTAQQRLEFKEDLDKEAMDRRLRYFIITI